MRPVRPVYAPEGSCSQYQDFRRDFDPFRSQTRHTFSATLPSMATKTATPWGAATLVEELSVPQRAGEKRFATIVQLLENERGERLLRFAYSTGGTARRGPVTLRGRDLERLRAALAEHPQLAEVLTMS